MSAAAEKFPSFNWMRGVADDRTLTLPRRFILMRLFLFRNDGNGLCYPSYDTVAEVLNVDRATIIRAVADGVRRGWLAPPTRRGPTSNLFVFTFPVHGKAAKEVAAVRPQDAEEVAAVRPLEGKEVAPVHKRSRTRIKKKSHQCDPNGVINGKRERGSKREHALAPPDGGSLGKGSKSPAERIKPEAKPVPADTAAMWAEMGTEEYALASLRGQARRQRLFPLPKNMKIDSGDAEPFKMQLVIREEWRENYQRAWNKLSGADQEILADYVSESGIGTPQAKPEPQAELVTVVDDGFARFWTVYPRKVEQEAARAEFARAIKGGADIEVMIARARVYAIERATAIAGGDPPKFTVYPATWLKKKKWNDPPPPGLVVAEAGHPLAIEQQEEDGEEESYEVRFDNLIGRPTW
jgi:hypothetical protein